MALAALGIVAGNATLFGVLALRPSGCCHRRAGIEHRGVHVCGGRGFGRVGAGRRGGGGDSAGCVVGDGPDGWKALQEGVAPLGDADGGGDRVAGGLGCGGAGGGGGVSVGAYSLAQAVLSGAAAAVLLPSLGRVVPDGAAVLLAVAVGCAGLTRFTYLGASLGTTFGLYSCAVGGLAAGPGAAAIAGAAAGLGVGVSSAGSGELVAMLALGGAAVGAASRQGRAVVGFALLGVAAVCGYCFHSEEAYTARLIEAALAAGVLMVTPERVVSALARRVPQPGVGAGWPGGGAVTT